ncbi:unnamed protein product [Closterium sp. NIES-65]|nr:unnamed protein product [Closterium sp. NIES-65]
MSAPPAATIIISVLVALLLVVLFALGIKMLLDRSKAARSEDTVAPEKATTVITTPRSLSSARMKPRQGAVHVVGGTDDDEDAEIPRARAEKWSLADVAEATAQFAQERVIEAEGQSVVLRGIARDGRDVAVKRCKQPQPETQALFLREVRWLWRRVIWVMGGGLAAGGGLLLSVLLRGGQAVQAAAARDPGAVSPRGALLVENLASTGNLAFSPLNSQRDGLPRLASLRPGSLPSWLHPLVMLITSVRHPSLLPLVGNCDEEADTHFRAHAARLLNPLAYIPALPPLPPCQVMLITSLRHPNLLPLVGYCDEGSEQILIFEHMQHGSLASWLRPRADGNVSRPPLTFEQRVRIAADVARAVEFLHSQPKPVVHRDIKTQTILLDEKFNAKLGGLGTRKHLPGESSRVRVQRRKGYLDPEYCQTFVVTTKAEIFA